MRAFLMGLVLVASAVAQKPNVVILFTDDQGTLDANCYGSTDLHTPNIDRLAAAGVRFTQAYAHKVCCPSRAALLTGRHPQRGGVNHWTQGDMNGADGINMALEEVTIAEALKAEGYRTALFGKWHLGAHRDFGPKKQGFDEFFGIRDGEWKLIGEEGRPKMTLHRLTGDKPESFDYAKNKANIVARLTTLHQEWASEW